jgi:hypothetical protein
MRTLRRVSRFLRIMFRCLMSSTSTDVEVETLSAESEKSFAPAFLSFGKKRGVASRFLSERLWWRWFASVAVIGVPAGWYSKKKVRPAPAENVSQAPAPQAAGRNSGTTATIEHGAAPATEDPAALALPSA